MRNQIILFLGLLLPAAVSAQIPSMTANTLIKLQKDNVTWLARLDSLSVFLDNSSAGGIYGNGSAGSGSNTLPPGGSTITIPGQFQPLSFTMDCESSYEVTAIRMTTDFTSDDAASKYIVGKSPVDSLEIYNFDGGTIIKETGGTLTLFGDKEIYLYADSISMASVPQRTIAAHLMGQDATGFVRRIQGASSGQILKWNGTAWALAADDTGGGGGESNTASNVGSGAGWYKQKTGVDLEFKTIVAGGGISVANNTSDLTVSTTAPQPASSETIEASNFTATMRRINLVDCSAGTITVTPPSSPAIGDRFAVVDAEATAATNNITIDFDTANHKLYAVEQNYIINVAGGYVEFIYMGTTTGWVATKG